MLIIKSNKTKVIIVHGKLFFDRNSENFGYQSNSSVDMQAKFVSFLFLSVTIKTIRWDLIAGRIPGKTGEEIKHFWRKRKVSI